MPLDADPDLLSFEHHLLAVKAFIASGGERNRKGFRLDVAGMALHRSSEHAIRDVARVDSILDVEAKLLAPVLDGSNHLARQSFELELLGDHGVQVDHGGAKRDALHVQ